MFALGIVMVCVILAAFGQVSMKQGMNDVGSEGIGKLLNFNGFLKIFREIEVAGWKKREKSVQYRLI